MRLRRLGVILILFAILQGDLGVADNGSQKIIYTEENLGINLPWLDLHNGNVAHEWLGSKYNSKLIDQDLATIRSLGVTKIRSFTTMESIYNFENGTFSLNEDYAKNLDDFLDRADNYGMSVILIMGDMHYERNPDIGGKLHLDMIQKSEGLDAYKRAYIDYVNRFKRHKNILMWEIVNEPYGSMTWSKAAKELNLTQEQVHTFLKQSYQAIKPLADNIKAGKKVILIDKGIEREITSMS